MTEPKNPRPDWADEPTPLCDDKEIYYSDIGYGSNALRYMEIDDARDLERRLRHALKQVNSLRIDAMHAYDPGNNEQLAPEILEQQLSEIERTLTP